MSFKDVLFYIGFIALIILILWVATHAMMNDEKARETLDKAGFTNVAITGIGPLDCSDDDYIRTRFEADNPQGIRISGTVCCGIFKKCTIRY